jgi:bifunctional enzyme CysN/CysC
MRDVRVVVVGHVDHGKSTVIGRLLYETGSLPQRLTDALAGADGPPPATAFALITDQLSEEQQGSFTLDVAQARLRTGGRDYTLIDTPGHREFLKNMVTGTTRADAALLVVDAAEGPLAQTYLHAYLLAMLGVRQVILAVNKMDLVSYDHTRFHLLARQLSIHLERLGIPPAVVIPVSAQQGDHIVKRSERMPWNAAPPLAETLGDLAPLEPEAEQPLRLLVQCSFPVRDGRAILGKVVSGTLRSGQALIFGPHRQQAVIAAVTVARREMPGAIAGQCVEVLLRNATAVERGHVGFDDAHAPVITDRLTARVFWIHPRPLAVSDEVEILCGTQCRRGYVESITRLVDPVSLQVMQTEAACLEDSQVAEVTLRTDAPVCIDPFDVVPELGRFAILQNGRTVGGGITT